MDDFTTALSIFVETELAETFTEYANEVNDEPIKQENSQSFWPMLGNVALPILLVIGICGNLLTIKITQTKTFKDMSVARIMTVIAVSDTCVLLMIPFNKPYVRQFVTLDIRALDPWSCFLFFWFFRSAKMTSSWFVVLISVERFIAVWFPFKASTFITNRSTDIAICAVYLVIGGFNIYWGYSLDRIVGDVCVPNTSPLGMEDLAKILVPSGVVVYAILPCCLLMLFNVLIIGKIIHSRHKTKQLSETAQQDLAKLMKTTVMLMGISTAFLILVAPIALSHLIGFIMKFKIYESQIAWVVVMREITQVMELMNYSTNFFMYVLGGAHFRKRALLVLKCSSNHKKPIYAIRADKRETCESSLAT